MLPTELSPRRTKKRKSGFIRANPEPHFRRKFGILTIPSPRHYRGTPRIYNRRYPALCPRKTDKSAALDYPRKPGKP
jgi:hypothetical protein